ncbi:peroxiredoxin [Arthrobacter sp. UYCu712]|uniref:peroxiredoxin n=1 Tax=Arthrobacter sp. UYCu712 TaxID=3156340 RepID=UPI0033910DB8
MTDEQQADSMSLVGRRMPSQFFPSTQGNTVDLSDTTLSDYVLFIYPRTGRPDEPEAAEWALIPGAKGCSAESCEFRDLAADYAKIGFSIFGLSTQATTYQQEAAERLHLPYSLLSDPEMELGHQLALDYFAFEGSTLYKRCTLVVRDGVITQAHLYIADPASHPRELLASLERVR